MKKKIGIFVLGAMLAAAAVPAVLTTAGCSVRGMILTDERPRYFVLSSDVSNADAGSTLPIVMFSRITIPSYLDVPQIVTRDGNAIARSEMNRWGESLSRAVSRELALRTADALVSLANSEKAQNSGSGESAEIAGTPTVAAAAAGTRVLVVFDRFDGTLGGNVELSAVYTLTPPDSGAEAGISKLFKTTVPVPEPNDCDAYVRALDASLDAFARDIAAELKKFDARKN